MIRIRGLLFSLLLCLFSAATPALDDIQSVTAVWSDFVASIRRGDYRNAHSLFSAESRVALPYAEFVAEYGPLSPAREMVLAKPESQATDLDGDWAELNYGGTNPGTGRKFKVGVSFVRNLGGWGLVAARNETAERVEAGIRTILRMVWDSRGRAPARELVAMVTAANSEYAIFRFYRLEAVGERFQAFPLRSGLRTFYVDESGVVRSVEQSEPPVASPRGLTPPPERSAMPPPPMPEPPPAFGDGMPEMAEPPTVYDLNVSDELPEPPPPGAMRWDAPAAPLPPPAVTLPDAIR